MLLIRLKTYELPSLEFLLQAINMSVEKERSDAKLSSNSKVVLEYEHKPSGKNFRSYH